jgi:hypothetical protein
VTVFVGLGASMIPTDTRPRPAEFAELCEVKVLGQLLELLAVCIRTVVLLQ